MMKYIIFLSLILLFAACEGVFSGSKKLHDEPVPGVIVILATDHSLGLINLQINPGKDPVLCVYSLDEISQTNDKKGLQPFQEIGCDIYSIRGVLVAKNIYKPTQDAPNEIEISKEIKHISINPKSSPHGHPIHSNDKSEDECCQPKATCRCEGYHKPGHVEGKFVNVTAEIESKQSFDVLLVTTDDENSSVTPIAVASISADVNAPSDKIFHKCPSGNLGCGNFRFVTTDIIIPVKLSGVDMIILDKIDKKFKNGDNIIGAQVVKEIVPFHWHWWDNPINLSDYGE